MGLPLQLGRVVKQISPERCTFIKSTGYPLIPGNYVDIILNKKGDKISAIIEDSTGEEKTAGGARYARYEYYCKVLTSGVAYELVGTTVFIPDHAASLTKLFSGKSNHPLKIGELSGVESHVPVILNGENLRGTHSCIFGNSGSGKTTLLGLLIEEILLNIADAQVIVLDLNSDFAKFNELRPESDVNSDDNPCEKIKPDAFKKQQDQLRRISMKLITLPQIRMDRFVFTDLLQLQGVPIHFALDSWFEQISKSFTRDKPISPKACEELVRKRIKHAQTLPRSLTGAYPLEEEELKGLAILHDFFKRMKDAPIWSSEVSDSLDLLRSPEDSQFIEYNLGGLRFSHRAILAEAVLRTLWERNEKTRHPTFIIIDEAHNLAPAVPEEPWQKRTLEWINRISGEGRKYGLYLVLVSQRPAKIHANALDNCKNFFVLKLQNQDDLQALSKSTMDVSAQLISRAATFRRHEALIYGDLGPPAIISTGRRRMR